jgi:hypothetical protein
MGNIIVSELLCNLQNTDAKLISLNEAVIQHLDRQGFYSFLRFMATKQAREKRNKRFNRNRRRGFKKVGGYRYYIAGETVFYKENITMTLTNTF